jgi:TRAP-type C4-dicarboxylate transport system permease small subunit
MPNAIGRKLLQFVEKILEVITMVGFIGMLLSTGGQVVFRYVLRISVPWTEELARILFISTMFLGIAIAIRENEHIVVDFLFKKLNRRYQAVGQILYNSAIFILLCFLARGTIAMTKMTWDSYMIALDWIRTGYLYFVEFIAVIFMMLYVVMKIHGNLIVLRSDEKI